VIFIRLWHQKLIPYLDRQRLLGQHRECAALRGKGWGKKHSVVDYVFTHEPAKLVAYHHLIMNEMERRGYQPDTAWRSGTWRGSALGESTEDSWQKCRLDSVVYMLTAEKTGAMIYPEHNDAYLRECIALLKEKDAPIDWEKVRENGLDQV
jgi:uncharacterized protein (TIGR02328 family)